MSIENLDMKLRNDKNELNAKDEINKTLQRDLIKVQAHMDKEEKDKEFIEIAYRDLQA